ncbi:putative cysteine-rich receptor-like protein kinase 20 [Phragmites australis]|uniref:putative cysteine-rich receptor-like protein kinase 20 n=1 Tax=Phragmites australis TaxID=29695 RepID=UPI002D76AA5F|nr:putative cysteine-rich receptor-like protein kinase 20 [Phragmites australis]
MQRKLDMVALPCLLPVLLSFTPLPLFVGAAAYSDYSCNGTTGNFTSGSAFGDNLDRLVAALPTNASSSPSLFASAAIGAAPDTVYGLALCRGDITDPRVCSACLGDAFRRLRRLCGADRDATFYHDLCTARYSGGDFLARPDDNSPVINAMDVNGSTYYGWDARNATSRSLFLSLVGMLFGEMAMYGAYNSSATRLFASGAMYVNPQLPTVYGFVQCTPDLSRSQCWHCFQGVQEQNRQWYDGREGGRILGVRCSFRYEAYQFFDGTPDVRIGLRDGTSSPTAGSNNGSNHKKALIVALAVSITVFCAMLVACLLLTRAQRKRDGKTKLQVQAHSRNSSTTEEALKLWQIEESSSEFTLYDFADLAAATGGFSDENRLGRGGFGPVYKGKLGDGAEIAVKRLAAHSGQGLVEFKNEIQLIAKLQHTNLVRLVGCCVQEEEKLLVYEYMPNRSLNCFIFDQQRGPLLDWQKRLHIIEGIAQGLLYLHKHSRVRIIHRDLKASNILLDKDLNPKISDFGMARIFGSNMTEANTNRVVGTYGYMAPEYASEGIFSVKSDVYSFGVLLLEIISGKRNSGHRHHYGDFVNLLGYVWQLWREGRAFELVDPTLGECGDVASIMRYVKVALLCVQDSAMDRPTMAEVTAMLSASDGAAALPDPGRPPHFSLRVTSSSDDDGGPGMPTRSHCTTSFSTNDLTITTIQEGR